MPVGVSSIAFFGLFGPHALEDGMLAKRLAAATAAYVAVHVKGRAVAELQKDAVMLGRRVENNRILFPSFSLLFSM